MEGQIQDYCKLGVVHFMLYKFAGKGEGEIVESLETLCNNDQLGAVEVTWIKDKGQRAEAAALLKQSGKAVGFGAHPIIIGGGLDLNHKDEDKRHEAIDKLRALMEQAYELGASGFVVLSGKDPGEDGREDARARLVDSLKELDAELKKQGSMPLILEPFDRVDFGKNCLVGPHPEAALVAEEMRKSCPDFGLLPDLSHIPILDEKPEDAVKAIKDYIVHAHIGNCVIGHSDHEMYGDMHPPLCDPHGVNGVDEVAEYLKALLDIGFLDKQKRPVVSFEICIYKDWTPDDLLQQSIDVANEAFAKV